MGSGRGSVTAEAVTLEEARARDAADPLAHCRARFRLPDGKIYLDGNSLGALPADAPQRIARTVEQEWGDDLIESWNRHGWIDAPATTENDEPVPPVIGELISTSLLANTESWCPLRLTAVVPASKVTRPPLGALPFDCVLISMLLFCSAVLSVAMLRSETA